MPCGEGGISLILQGDRNHERMGGVSSKPL